MDLTALVNPLQVTSFDTYFGGVAGTQADVEVWVRSGSYVGFDGSSSGWTLSQTVSAFSAGINDLAAINLANPINLATGQVTAVYLHSITVGNGIRYHGLGGGGHNTTVSNDDLMLFSDVARTGNIPFGGGRFEPRTFAGNVNYTVIPAPGALALLGLAGLAVRRRRRA